MEWETKAFRRKRERAGKRWKKKREVAKVVRVVLVIWKCRQCEDVG